jgi:hypothetical protein
MSYFVVIYSSLLRLFSLVAALNTVEIFSFASSFDTSFLEERVAL